MNIQIKPLNIQKISVHYYELQNLQTSGKKKFQVKTVISKRDFLRNLTKWRHAQKHKHKI